MKSGRIPKGNPAGVGKSGRFQKGAVPANKGLRRPGFAPGRMGETQFKPGNQRNDTLPLGGLRLESKQKTWLVKVKLDGPIQDRYKPLARIIWERERGPIPPKHAVRISGWDKANPDPPEAVTIDRLECITLAENCRRNSLYRYPKEIQDAIKTKGALTRAINRKQGKKRNDKSRRRKQRQHDLRSPISDLRMHLFATIKDLRDPQSKMDVETAKAIKGVADSIIESAKAEVKARELLGSTAGLPSFLQIKGPGGG